ncbi:MAG: DUF5719 family protein [Actinomycetota bacterium]
MRKLTVISLALLLVTLLGGVAIAGGADEWSQYQKDVQHVGAIDLALPDTNNVSRRTAAIDARDGSQPVVAGNRAYVYAGVAGTSGSIYCFDLNSGAQAWKTDVTPVSGMDSWSTPAVYEGVVYIGSGTKVHALDAASGASLWTRDLEAIKAGAQVVNSSPAVGAGRLVIGDFGNGCYYCLDTSDNGKLLWTFDLEASCMAVSTACIAGDRVFVGQGAAFGAPVSPNGKVWCVDMASGDAVTSWGTGGSFTTVGKQDMTGTVTAFGDFIYFTDFTYGAATEPNCYLYCLRAQTGAEAWKVPVFGSDGAPSVVDGYIVTSGQAAGAWPAPGVNWTTCVSADTTTGTTPEQVWTKSGMGGNNMSVCISGDRVAVGQMTTSWPVTATDTWLLNMADGSTVWHSTEAGSPPVATPYGLLSLGDGKMITFGGGTPASDFYFAEGTTRDGYQEWICLENPTEGAMDAQIDYMTDTGQTATQDVRLEPMTRTTVDVNLFMGSSLDVSAHVHGPGRFVAERAIYFETPTMCGGEQVMGVTAPSKSLLYAEGTTRAGFQTWMALENPGESDANVVVTYLFADGSEPIQENRRVPAHSRMTVDVNAKVGADRDVSIAVTSSVPIVGERVMYFTLPTPILGVNPAGVHNCTGVEGGRTNWYFAEGTTRQNFSEWLCLMNPGAEDATATVQYLAPGGVLKTQTAPVPANSRFTVSVNQEVGPDADVGMLVTSDRPLVAERPMYFQFCPVDVAGQMWGGGHDSAGAPYSAYRWEFAEGCTRDGYQTFLCISNPGPTAAPVTIDYYIQTSDGGTETMTEEVSVSACSRITVFVNDSVGPGRDVAANVSSTVPVVVERPMYFGGSRCGGGDSRGLPAAL